MAEKNLNLLLIEDEETDARLIGRALAQVEGTAIAIRHAVRLSAGLELARQSPFDAVLLDLNLPDSRGLLTVQKFLSEFPRVPVVVLTGLEDASMAEEAVRAGAQDYVSKNRIDPLSLYQSIRFAILRHRLHVKDELDTRELARIRAAGPADKAPEQAKRAQPSLPIGEVSQQPVLGTPNWGAGTLADFQKRIFARRLGIILGEGRNPRTPHYYSSLSERLKSLAEELGRLNAATADIFGICDRFLQDEELAGDEAMRAAFAPVCAEARLLLLGHLLSFYREKR